MKYSEEFSVCLAQRKEQDLVLTKSWPRHGEDSPMVVIIETLFEVWNWFSDKFGFVNKCKCFEWMFSCDMLLYSIIITQILFLYFSLEKNLYFVVNTLSALPGAVGLMSNYTPGPWTRQGCVFRTLLWRPYRVPLPPKLLNSVILSIKYLYY